MPYRNIYWKSILGVNAQVLISLGVAYTAQATYALFVANSVEGELGIFNADTQALISSGGAVATNINIFVAVNRGGTKGPWTQVNSIVPNIIETSITFQLQNGTPLRQAYDAPILQFTQVAYSSRAALTIQDITYRAKAAGAASAITIANVVAGNSTALSIGVAANAITVNEATSAGGVAISTAAQIQAAIIASAPASALVTASITGTASNVQTAVAATNLAGGTATAAVVAGQIFNLSILETTVGYQPFPTWDYQYVAVTGDTEDTVAAKLVAMINNTQSIQNRDRDLVVTAAYANGVITVTAIYFGSTFNVLLKGSQLDVIADVVPVQTAHAGSGTADQVRMFQQAGDVFKGVTTQYPLQGAQPGDYGQPDDFVALNVVKNFDIFSFSGFQKAGSKTFLHQQYFKQNLFIIVPTSGTTPTAAIKAILGL